MSTKTISRLAAIAATIGIAGIPLTITAPANAITKPEPGVTANVQPPSTRTADSGFNLDLAQIGAGTLGGIAITGAGLAAVGRLRRHKATL
ncbi:hypothetical protein [Kribbella soli]|uniref:LPXTG cell wall anchor domain-containing protein n=1 Tax=Kribbella soli TaxID=1124743 RepID=A0A4R0H962_9ACTN|nr:hypothetical protein [Kribbella soli]TCC04219.1 hypothetical protein E0H45_34635 [Kribbella soli]